MDPKSKTCLFIIILQIINYGTCQEEVKRAPQGFFGMRGKKYFNDEYEQFYKRKPQFFVGVKGKKNLLDLLEDSYYKRAPMGFVGMRGKKASYQPEFDILPPSGSLIGRIDYTADDVMKSPEDYAYIKHLLSEYLNDLPNSEEMESGEAVPERISNEVEKRAATYHQFFGVRGKKSVQNKRPFDVNFRGKFIGVRGKKDVRDNRVQEIKFLLDHSQPWQKRKGHVNGFFGMRGKKWSEDSTESSETAEITSSI